MNPVAMFRPRLSAVTLWLLMTALIATSTLAHSDTRVFELSNRPAEDVAGQIRPLYQQDGVALTAQGQQLVVRGEPRLLEEIAMLVNSFDVPPVQMRVTVRYRQDIGGKRSGGGVSINNGAASANVQSKTISTTSSRQRRLVVQDGQSAHITSGTVRTLPFAVKGGRNPAAILQQVTTRSGFVVSPRALSSEAVELTIVSFEEDPAAIEGYETEALMTIRQVEPGQWVPLGGTKTEMTGQQDGIAYRVTGKRSENMAVEVKVEVLP